MIGFFANIFGYLLNILYDLLKNYGVAIIIFSIILKVLLLPISIKQQKTMKKSGKIQKELKEIQSKYKNDPQKMNQETMDLYKRENMNPFSGCLSAIVQIIILLSMFYLVRSPLTYMRKIDSNIVSEYTEQIKKETNADNLTYPEIAIIRDANNFEETKKEEQINEENIIEEEKSEITDEGISENESKIEEEEKVGNKETEEQEEEKNIKTPKNIEKMKINMEFLGLDLSSIPNQQLKDYRVYIIPVLYVLSTFLSMKVTTKLTSTKKEDKEISKTGEEKPNDMDALNSMNKNMTYIMPILSVSISLVAPLGLALYWLVNNILMILEKTILSKLVKTEED